VDDLNAIGAPRAMVGTIPREGDRSMLTANNGGFGRGKKASWTAPMQPATWFRMFALDTLRRQFDDSKSLAARNICFTLPM